MKTIGLIGGMSWESSKVYYEVINRRTKELAGGSHSAKSIINSVDFATIEELSFAGNWEEIGEMMAECSIQLEKAGADIILLCTNTIHIVANTISSSVKIPFLHIADTTGAAIAAKGLKKVALLGTRFTMEKDFYKATLTEKYGLEVIVPTADDQLVLNKIIYEELVLGQFTEMSKRWCLELIKKLTKEGAEGVILGCTELPILIPEDEVNIPSFDTGKIHAHKAVEWALS